MLTRRNAASPSTDLRLIEQRHHLVSVFLNDQTAREDLRDALGQLAHIDYVRLLQKILLGRGAIDDLHLLVAFLHTGRDVQAVLRGKASLEGRDVLKPDHDLLLQDLSVALASQLSPSVRLDPDLDDSPAGNADGASLDEGDATDEASMLDVPRWLLKPS